MFAITPAVCADFVTYSGTVDHQGLGSDYAVTISEDELIIERIQHSAGSNKNLSPVTPLPYIVSINVIDGGGSTYGTATQTLTI